MPALTGFPPKTAGNRPRRPHFKESEMKKKAEARTETETEIEALRKVFAGTGDKTEEADKCSDDCVGGTANTAAMRATY
jgi:hypothetical protein